MNEGGLIFCLGALVLKSEYSVGAWICVAEYLQQSPWFVVAVVLLLLFLSEAE
jgi:hypothetical protein